MCARQHCDAELGSPVEYQLLGTQLDSDPMVTFEGYCTLVFQASVVSDHRQDEESTLKVIPVRTHIEGVPSFVESVVKSLCGHDMLKNMCVFNIKGVGTQEH